MLLHLSEWKWTDRRDGKSWNVSGVWYADDMVMGPVAFHSEGCSTRVSYCGVTRVSDRGLQQMLDGAAKKDASLDEAEP